MALITCPACGRHPVWINGPIARAAAIPLRLLCTDLRQPHQRLETENRRSWTLRKRSVRLKSSS